jgi:hypothetical protein
MQWERRRDLEGGKELGVWLLVDETGTVERELYVESHEYRGEGEGFDVYAVTPGEAVTDDEWTHEGAYESVDDAFDRALALLSESGHPVTDG